MAPTQKQKALPLVASFPSCDLEKKKKEEKPRVGDDGSWKINVKATYVIFFYDTILKSSKHFIKTFYKKY